ncbi:MAG: NUDIX domain-containing protein [Candidatus Omnitrophota bacterium]|nr:MAG: NUDIX domain-containing protein [Candidatus Omnitrophota bacterium]
MGKKELDVVAALIGKDNKVLLCQRKENDRYALLWEFPGGCVEESEDFKKAIEREIHEELDLEVEAEKLIEEFRDEDQTLKIHVFLFKCLIKSGEPRAKDCKDFGFFTHAEIEGLNLAPADKKIFDHLKQFWRG